MKVFNNLSRKIEDFEPIDGKRVFIYSCGPTVYDISHVGHARSCITWDVFYRYLKFKGYDAKWIRNITNIDDKIVKRAKENNITPDQLSRQFTYEFWADMKALNISNPDFEPRATDYLGNMFEFIQGLIDKEFAYEAAGDVYFRVNKHPNYGQLKGQSLEELAEGQARVEANENKENRLDFALWKAFPNDPDSSYQSPWSLGRPGWHLECSTMIKAILEDHQAGPTIDVHAGGDDLMHPHHDNECAQSESLTGKPLAKYWMHNGMVMINGAKMSKSENNFFTIRDLLKDFQANTIRYFCLQSHYKKQINFSNDALKAAQSGFSKLLESLKPDIEKYTVENEIKIPDADLDQKLIAKFTEAMDEDLNTAKAFALLFDNNNHSPTTIYLLNILGFDLLGAKSVSVSSSGKSDDALTEAMDLVLELRSKARTNKDFATSDLIRDKLAAAGINIKDFRDKPSQWVLS